MWIKNIAQSMQEYKFSIFLMVVLIIVALMPINFALSKPIILGAISVFFLFSILVFNRFYGLVVFLFSVFIAFDAYFAYAFSSYINMGFFASMMETNANEARSMLATACLPALVIFTLLTTLFFLSAKELRKGKIKCKYLLITYFLTLVLIGIVYSVGYRREALGRYVEEYPILTFHNLVYTYTPLLYGDIASAVAYYDDIRRFKNFKSATNRPLPNGVEQAEEKDTPRTIMMIVGESAYKGNMSLYGYSEPTTPFLDSLKNNTTDTILNYYEGIAGANITRNALRLMMSFATPHQMDLFYKNKSLIDMAEDAGYETVWISNQGHSSLEETYIGYLSSSTDTAYFHTETFFKSNDLELLPAFKELLQPDKKQFIVLHLVGSHADYKDRYDEIDAKAINSANKDYQDYDRSIHHTDRFLREVYKIVEPKDDFLIYYTSDHGEEPGIGHGFKGDIRQFDVPMVFINHSSAPIDSILNRYIDSKTNKISNTNSPYFIGEVMGYHVQDSIIDQVKNSGMYVFGADNSVEYYGDITLPQNQK